MTSRSTNHTSLWSTSLSPSPVTAAITAMAVTVFVTTTTCVAFQMGYWMATYTTKRRIWQEIQDSTAGCCILLAEQHSLHNKDDYADDDSDDKDHIIPAAPRRFGACIQLKPEKYIEYRTLHDNVWDHVQRRLYDSHIRNFTIYYHKETSTLYQHFEWIGHWYAPSDLSVEEEQALLDADLYAITQDTVTREWWKLCEPCQQPFAQWYQQPQPQTPETTPTAKSSDTTTVNDTSSIQLLLPSEGNTTGDWWAPMECVCHTGHFPLAYSPQTYDPDFMKLNPNTTA